MLVIPAIDLLDGRCVRLYQGDFGRETTYGTNPLDQALAFEGEGAKVLHVVDLDGARTGRPTHLHLVERIAAGTSLSIELGGGIRSPAAAREALAAGVWRVVVGSSIAGDQELARTLFEQLGEQVVAGIDARNGLVAVHGWTETSTLPALDFALRMQELGAPRIILTDIDTDGALSGPNLAMLRSASQALRVPIIASGGVASLADLQALKQISNVEGAIVGRALYEGRFKLSEVIGALA
ncbi:MAG TPA: 1-(5-phosphoribosyl)-5-[(5-phosphoribosylamino)methylideneamino]imidazole-4-carboxamide isomerase [Fimbriimonadaceae bacterium]|nr:1-(5-phosphoribosyl)-5-[(5-phosphoribosylamino)methylideneamino]imidazole-4-carboxamide isomerase [Fimbriimonadaceae bacterium]